ncbi:MAG: AMP-binding protein [Gammaproteobacteria bacterium]|nr:AMP-binding protein [Gammaproteobacteria bacterium]
MSAYTPPASVLAAGQSHIGALFHSAHQAHPQHTAITDGDRVFTYAQLEERSNRLAHYLLGQCLPTGGLATRGLTTGDRVAILAANCAEYFELELAAAKSGLIVAALNWRLGGRELQHCIDLVSPKLGFVSPKFLDHLNRLELHGMPVITFGDAYESALAKADPTYPGKEIPAETGLVILYTSGTTGLPKGALISHRAMLARGLIFTSEIVVPRYDHFVAWAPMYHMASTDQGLAYLLRGGTVHMVDGYQPDCIIDLIEQFPMRWLLLMPGMIASFIEAVTARQPSIKGLGCIGAMADLIPRQEIAEVTALLNAPFLNTFGATETGLGPATGAFIDIGTAPERLPKRQTAFCDIRLVDADDNEVPVGVPGEVSITGPSLFSGYWNSGEVNREDFRGGRFHMGDVLRRNADGTLEYVDRVKYMIKSGGENIYPAEIEQVICADERIETAVVVRKPDARWGEIPVLFVVPRDESLTPAQITALCDRELSRYKRPREIYFVTDEELPRSTTGKIQRHMLEARV